MHVYEMKSWTFEGKVPEGSWAQVSMKACVRFPDGSETIIPGFYAGGNTYQLRFLPLQAGVYHICVDGEVKAEFEEEALPSRGAHGPVRARGTHLYYDDGTRFDSFGTTVYALMHQSDALTDETMESLRRSPFNKVRLCVFPKHYLYNHNEPQYYAFEKREDGSWDPHRPCMAFWDAFERKLERIFAMGIQVDLILFHPYDRWGFESMPQADHLVYLDYLLRRFAAYPMLWWSLANEYDLCCDMSVKDYEEIEEFVASHDPYHHMLGCHNCLAVWDYSRKNITHASIQTKCLTRTAERIKKAGKPVLIDECCYEGNLPEFWGSISGREMAARFWRVHAVGGYCTHGETYLPGTEMSRGNTATGEEEVVWWARGGILHGESVSRIAFLRRVMERLPGPLEPLDWGWNGGIGVTDAEMREKAAQGPEGRRFFMDLLADMGKEARDDFCMSELEAAGHCGEQVFLWYKDLQCSALSHIRLPENAAYDIYVIDTWNMTCSRTMEDVSGQVDVQLPGREAMAILALDTSLRGLF